MKPENFKIAVQLSMKLDKVEQCLEMINSAVTSNNVHFKNLNSQDLIEDSEINKCLIDAVYQAFSTQLLKKKQNLISEIELL